MANPNPFAIVVMAHLKSLETRHAPDQRFTWKWRVTMATMALYDRTLLKQLLKKAILTPSLEQFETEFQAVTGGR